MEVEWTFLRREKFLAAAKIQTLDHPPPSLVNVLTKLSQFFVQMSNKIY